MMKLIQVASELGINRNTVRDRLDHYGLRRTRQTTRRAADLGRQSRPIACNGHGARSSLPVEVLAWLAGRLAHLTPPRPPGRGGTPPLALEVRLDAVAAVLLDGLSYRRAGRAVGISKTEGGGGLDLLLDELAAVGFCQPDGSFVTTLDDLGALLADMATSGEAVRVDGLATRVWRYRPSGGTCCGATAAGRGAATSRN
jgi:hypothetical protein